ncbi:triose-phosphate isomerase [Candidatus Woesearchaeota archaeon]|nr:triose-phosphate isomerase [Candidatus Woesearchaeota archaeon]
MVNISTPVIILNFKTYRQGTGENAVELAKACELVEQESGIPIVAAVQAADIYRVVSSVDKLKVIAQHMDPVEPGKNTGFITPEAIQQAGAIGSIINHAEHQLPLEKISELIKRAKALDLFTVVCADTARKAGEVARLGPDMVSVEPPELIGTGISVSKAKPDLVRSVVEKVHAINPELPALCGAGITEKEDVIRAVQQGAQGILLASGVVLSKDPEGVLRELAAGFR